MSKSLFLFLAHAELLEVLQPPQPPREHAGHLVLPFVMDDYDAGSWENGSLLPWFAKVKDNPDIPAQGDAVEHSHG